MEQTLQESVKSRELVFKVHEIAVFLCGWESSSSVGETDNTGERRELWAVVFLQMKENTIFCASGGQASARSMGPSILSPGRAGGKYGLRSRSVVEEYAVSFHVTLRYFQECMMSESEEREEALELEGRSEGRHRRERMREQSWEMRSSCQTVSGCT